MAFGSNSFHQRAGDVNAERIIGFVGQPFTDHTTREVTITNKDPQAAQVTTMDVAGSFSAGTSRTFTIAVGGTTTTVTYASVAGDTDLAGVATAIAAQVNDTPAVRGFIAVTSSSVTLTFTGQYPGISFTIAESDSNLDTPSTTTTAAEGATVAFGLAIISLTFDGASRLGHVPVEADFTAQVMTFTITGGAGAGYVTTVSMNGTTYTSDLVVYNTSVTQTATDIATEINALMPAGTTVAATSGVGTIILTADVPGAEFDANIIVTGTAFDSTKVLTTGPSTATSFERVFAGVSMRDEHIENLTRGGDDPAYPANYGVRVNAAGRIVVTNSQDPSFGDEVWVSLATATKGLFYNSAAANRVRLPRPLAEWDRNEPSTQSQDVAVLRVNTGRVG